MLRPRPSAGSARRRDLYVRMYLLHRLRADHGLRLPELWRRTGQAAHTAGAKADRKPAVIPSDFARRAVRSLQNCGCCRARHLTVLSTGAAGFMFFQYSGHWNHGSFPPSSVRTAIRACLFHALPVTGALRRGRPVLSPVLSETFGEQGPPVP